VVWRSGATSALDRRQIAASRNVGAAAAFSRRVAGRILAFRASGGRLTDQQTSSTWDQFGRATGGPLTGARLTPATAPTSPSPAAALSQSWIGGASLSQCLTPLPRRTPTG
jgi:hypothetical protein